MGKKNEAKKEKSTIIDPDENKITKKKKKSKKTKKEKKRAKKEKRSKVKELENEEQSKDLKNSTDQRMLLTDALNKANKKNEENTNDLDTAMAERQLMVDILKKVNKKHKKNKKNKKRRRKVVSNNIVMIAILLPSLKWNKRTYTKRNTPKKSTLKMNMNKILKKMNQKRNHKHIVLIHYPIIHQCQRTQIHFRNNNNIHIMENYSPIHIIHFLMIPKILETKISTFSKFDEGIYMSSELWFSVTPEKTAKYIAELFKSLLPSATKCCDVACGVEVMPYNLHLCLTMLSPLILILLIYIVLNTIVRFMESRII